MQSFHKIPLAGYLLFLCFGFSLTFSGKALAHYPFKLIPGMPFSYFELNDLNNQRWASTFLRGKPVIIVTGHRYHRYEILKWAEAIKRDFWATGAIHLLWVANCSRIPFSTSRQTVVNQWRAFAPPVPLLLDWHAALGRALRINYGAPNIIGIDAAGRFAFHEMHTYSPEVYMAVAEKISVLTTGFPGMPGMPGMPGKIGKRGFSN